MSQSRPSQCGRSGDVLQVLGDFLRILLDVMNCILTLNLGRNPELVYGLLHKQEVFQQLQGQQGFAELVDNLQVGGINLVTRARPGTGSRLHC